MNAKMLFVRLTAATLLAAICFVPTTADAAKQKKQQKHQGAAAPAGNAGSAVISGTVKNRSGHGVGGATVLLKGTAAHTNHTRGAGRRARTGSGGGFTLRTAPGRYAVIASKRGVGRQRVNIAPGAGSVTNFTVILGSHHHSHHRQLHFRHRRAFVPVRVPTPPQSMGTSSAPKK